MKLRNKKTGEIVDAYSIEAQNDEIIRIQYFTKNGILNHFDFDSIEEMNNVLEDYKPAEPLIKDEKIRKAVRAFAEVMGVSILELVYCGTNGEFYMGPFSLQIHQIDIPSDTYTIAELCGEEEE